MTMLISAIAILTILVIVLTWFLYEEHSAPKQKSPYQLDIEAHMRKRKMIDAMREYAKRQKK